MSNTNKMTLLEEMSIIEQAGQHNEGVKPEVVLSVVKSIRQLDESKDEGLDATAMLESLGLGGLHDC